MSPPRASPSSPSEAPVERPVSPISDVRKAAAAEPTPDTLTPLLQSLMIGVPSQSQELHRASLQANDPVTLSPVVFGNPIPKSFSKPPPGHAPQPERENPGPVGCTRCGLERDDRWAPCVLSCCAKMLCSTCLTDALHQAVQCDIWHHLGFPNWVTCLAKSCKVLRTPQDMLVNRAEIVSSHPAVQRAISMAQSARNAVENIRPRPTRNECELAERLHKSLVDLGLMSIEGLHAGAVSVSLFPVRSGFLTQPVPILRDMIKTTTKTCVKCASAFPAVDTSNRTAWDSARGTFPGDWAWMILGRPSKAVLPECAEKHSLDICPTCLPRLMFSGLEFIDSISRGGKTYRFHCPLCKHTLSPVQVERLARLISPERTPSSLSGFSISAGSVMDSSATKPISSPSTVTNFFTSSRNPTCFLNNSSNTLFGGSKVPMPFGGPPKSAQQPDDSSAVHREALMSSIVTKKPNVRWDDVAGLTPAKHELQRAIIFPARFPNLYDEKRRASGAILLYGPPGTGKSYLARAVATEVDHTLFSISAGDVVSKWVGESEKLVRQLFALARENKPSIIFIDEIDALCAHREGSGGISGSGGGSSSEHGARMKTEILVQLDGLGAAADNTGVVVLAATNLPWMLDPAFRRRFEPRIYVPLPDRAARRQLFRIHAGDKWGGLLSEQDLDELAGLTEGYSGSDVANAVRHALAAPLRRAQVARWFKVTTSPAGEEVYMPCGADDPGAIEMTWEKVPKNGLWEPPVTVEDFKQVLKERRVKSSVGAGELQKYVGWTNEFGVDGNGSS